MRSVVPIVALLCALCVPLAAHFTFVVPVPDSRYALVVLSETPEPDREVDVTLIADSRLSFRGLDGRERVLPLVKGGEYAYGVELPSNARGVVYGITDLGVTAREGAPANLLVYHPKTIVGDAFDPRTRLGNRVAAELIPQGSARSFRLRLLGHGKALAGAEITVIQPDGASRVVKTNAAGETEAFSTPGRYGAWARYWEKRPGERDGRTYQEVRHYATIVFEVAASAAPAAQDSSNETAVFGRLPEASSSFGAVESGGYLYIYGGHIVPTHSYSTDAVSGRFHRLKLSNNTWETLPPGPPLQGLNLVAHGGKIYRVGGMQPQNKAGEPEDVRSVASVARFDPATKRWEDLPPMLTPRSSHDVVAVGDTLVVVGGWALKGTHGSEWADSIELLDLSSRSPEWRALPQPFQRRALIAAALDGQLWVMGGLDPKGRILNNIEVYDVKSNRWSHGPELPGGERSGFGPAAAVQGRALFVSLGSGDLYRLDRERRWTRLGRTTPRSVHRLIADSRRVLVIGGAANGENSDLIELLPLAR